MQDVAVFVGIDEVTEKLAVGHMPDGNEDAFQFQLVLFTGDEVFQHYRAHFTFFIGEVFRDGGVPNGFDLRIRERAVRHDLRGAQSVAAVDQIDGAGKFGEETGLFTSAVTATDDAYGHVAVESTIAGRATGQTVADEGFFVRQAEVFRRCTSGDDDAVCLIDRATFGCYFKMACWQLFHAADE